MRAPRPETWAGVIGNRKAVEILQEAVVAAQRQRQPLPHTLLYGPPGTGKTTLSKIVARYIKGKFFETTASTLETPKDMLRILFEMNEAATETGRPPVLFIDEIHMLGAAKGRQAIDQESVFPLLEDLAFPHNLINQVAFRWQRDEETEPVDIIPTTSTFRVSPFTCIGATTEAGMLSEPLRRRFLLRVEIQRYSEAEIARIIQNMALKMKWPCQRAATVTLSKYSRFNPGQAQSLLVNCRNRAVAVRSRMITDDIARAVIARMELYPLGLNDTDIRVLRALADRTPRGMGQQEIARAVGISPSQFNGVVEPYLRFMQMMETLSRRVITTKGLAYLASIGMADSTRPEVRAAIASQT